MMASVKASSIPGSNFGDYLLVRVARTYALLGRDRDAELVQCDLNSNEAKDSVTAALAVARARRGDFAEAIRMAALLPNELERLATQIEIARVALTQGQKAMVRELFVEKLHPGKLFDLVTRYQSEGRPEAIGLLSASFASLSAESGAIELALIFAMTSSLEHCVPAVRGIVNRQQGSINSPQLVGRVFEEAIWSLRGRAMMRAANIQYGA